MKKTKERKPRKESSKTLSFNKSELPIDPSKNSTDLAVKFIYRKAQLFNQRLSEGFKPVISVDRHKAVLSLMFAMNPKTKKIDMKPIARVIGTAYGTVKNWMSETKFKNVLALYVEEFTDDIIISIKNKIKLQKEQYDSILNLHSIDNIEKAEHPPLTYSELNGVVFYHPAIINRLFKKFDEWTNADDDPGLRVVIIDVLDFIGVQRGQSSAKEGNEVRRILRAKFESTILYNVICALKSPEPISEEVKKKFIFKLSNMKRDLDSEVKSYMEKHSRKRLLSENVAT